MGPAGAHKTRQDPCGSPRLEENAATVGRLGFGNSRGPRQNQKKGGSEAAIPGRSKVALIPHQKSR